WFLIFTIARHVYLADFACFFPSDFNLFRRYLVVPTPYLCFTVLSMTCHVRVISCHLGLVSGIFPLHRSNKVMFMIAP
ncbi:hypothetical protein P692DRAFT_20904584, partial [Suillus brevipes Sb2]